MIRIRLARLSDAPRISELLTTNAADHGGVLMGRWPVETIQQRIAAEQRIIVAVDDDARLLGALLTSEKGFEAAPPVLAMLEAWPGRADGLHRRRSARAWCP
jgi:hypothetical protein